MIYENINEQSDDKIPQKSYQHIIIVFYFALADCLHLFEVYILIFIHKLCTVFDSIHAISEANYKERPYNRYYKGDKT